MTSIQDRLAFYLQQGMGADNAAILVQLEAQQTQIQPASFSALLHPIFPDPSTVAYILSNHAAQLSAICLERNSEAAKALYSKAMRRMKTTTKMELIGRIPGLGLDGDHPATSNIKFAFEGTVPRLLKTLTDADAERFEEFPEGGFVHENIVSYRVERANGKVYMLMENLCAVLDQLPTFSSIYDCEVLCSCILRGLHYLHTQGFGHFDVKASNICITSEGKFKLVDLGSVSPLGSRSYATTESHVPINVRNRAGDVYDVTKYHDFMMLACTILYKAQLLSIPAPSSRYSVFTILETLRLSVYAQCDSVRELLALLDSPVELLQAPVAAPNATILPPI